MKETYGTVLWFTGLSGAGKTTTARYVYEQLLQDGWRVEMWRSTRSVLLKSAKKEM